MIKPHICGVKGGCVPKTGLARLRPVEEAVKDCSPRLVKAGPSVLLRGSTAQTQTPAPCLKPYVRQPNVFGASSGCDAWN